jgi:hypothetical protein
MYVGGLGDKIVGKGEKEAVGDTMMKSGNGDVRRMAPNSKLSERWLGYKTTPAPGSRSDEAQGAMAIYDIIYMN